jgi:hypothetical protein
VRHPAPKRGDFIDSKATHLTHGGQMVAAMARRVETFGEHRNLVVLRAGLGDAR